MDVNTIANRMSALNNESVQVIVRSRPIDERERRLECTEIVTVYPNRGVIEVENPRSRSENEPNKMFTYDAVYDEDSTQTSLYDETVRPLVASVLDGYNGCVFAYGQTGTGKTYTMEGVCLYDTVIRHSHGDGDDVPGDAGKGVIPRAFDQIWAHINRTTGTEFLVSVRYLEIYMENIRDLLRVKSTKPLELREQSGRGVFVSHLHTQTCQSASDMLKAMKLGNHNRTTGATNMNEHSSRSHAIFQIVVEMVNNVQGDAQQEQRTAKVGKLNLIDLAGSERQSKSGASGDRLKEATKINKSLSALGNVIYALAEASPHIPYRDSKLTRLLQDSLGGNSKTIMIANVGPASMNYDETIITLRYAYRAKSIKNQPIKNEDCRDAKLLELQDEISRLRALIAAKTSGGKLDLSILLAGEQQDGGSGGGGTADDTSPSSSDDDEGDVREGGVRLERLQSGKIEVDELGKKLRQLEKQMVHGGKNIVDSVNENEIRLEEQKSEISRRKKREIEMQQQLELEEESCEVIRQKFASVQQEVDYKRDMFKKLHNRLQGLKQEIKDNHANYLKDRQELAEANDEATMQLRQKLLIIDNFIPSEERSRLLGLAHFDEDLDNWQLSKNSHYLRQQRYLPNQRPVARTTSASALHYRRPISEYALTRAIATTGVRYRSENILDLKLDLPLRTTRDYVAPSICPQVKAAVRDIIIMDERNCHVVVKHGGGGGGMAPTVRSANYNHAASGGGISKAELEGRYKRASRSTVDIHQQQQQRAGMGNRMHPTLSTQIPYFLPTTRPKINSPHTQRCLLTTSPRPGLQQPPPLPKHRRHVTRRSLIGTNSSSNAVPNEIGGDKVRSSYSDSFIANVK